ncbi:MAG: hypothetical protein IKH63_01730 [Prevotella sp.]|jgi:hypothetical protein|nr:hypothetical protein [Prevotella sp.]MBR6936287.1 hypothetical protein [Prevotella sp.]
MITKTSSRSHDWLPVLSDRLTIVLLTKHVTVIRAMLAPNDVVAFVRKALFFLNILAYLLRLMIDFQNWELPRAVIVGLAE